jgi:hypothetical protein
MAEIAQATSKRRTEKYRKHGGIEKLIGLVLSTWHPLNSVTRWLEMYCTFTESGY